MNKIPVLLHPIQSRLYSNFHISLVYKMMAICKIMNAFDMLCSKIVIPQLAFYLKFLCLNDNTQLYFCNYFLQVCACLFIFVTNALDDFHTLGIQEPLLNDQQCKFKQQKAMLAHLTDKNEKEGPRVSLVMGSQGDTPDTLRWRGSWGKILGGRFC